MLGALRDRLRHARNLAMETYWSARRRRPGLDHLVRAYERYADRHGNQLAAYVTYFAFLSFFPLLALVFAVVGYAAAFETEVRLYLDQAINDVLPGIAEQLPIDAIARARAGAGILGLVGLLYAGLGAVAALRDALHQIWLKSVAEGPNIVVAKLVDALVMVVLGVALLASVALTSVAQTATHWLLTWVDLEGSVAAAAVIRLLGLAIAVGGDLVIFLVMFSRLSGTRRPWRLLWRGALLAAVAFEVLKAAGALVVGGTLGNPVYASFAVLVGLLVWINIVMRVVLFAAAWTATWLPVPPPYAGAPPMRVPVGVSSTDPPRMAVRQASSVHDAASLPARPSGRLIDRSERRARRRRGWAALRRAALPAAVVAGVAACAVWARRWLRYRNGAG